MVVIINVGMRSNEEMYYILYAVCIVMVSYGDGNGNGFGYGYSGKRSSRVCFII